MALNRKNKITVAFAALAVSLGVLGTSWYFAGEVKKKQTRIVYAMQNQNQTIEQQVLAQARSQLGLERLQPLQTVVEKRATFACTPGLARPGNATPDPGLWLAGDYTASPYPATLESAIQSGTTAARSVLKACGLKEVGVLGV